MTKISERNVFPSFSSHEEYLKLKNLFCDKGAYYTEEAFHYVHYSLYDILRNSFLKWPLRGSITSLEEMLKSFQIRDEDFNHDSSEERLLDYIQLILNAIQFFNTSNILIVSYHCNQGRIIQKAIAQNCALILEKLNAEVIETDSELYIAYKDAVAAAVSIQQPELAPCIIEYQKINNRDDLARKGEVLCSLAKILEPNEQMLNDNGYRQLCKDATFLLNKTGARHALDPNDGIEAQFLAMEDQERIKWYDRAFKTVLTCMAVLPYLDFREEIKDIKRNG